MFIFLAEIGIVAAVGGYYIHGLPPLYPQSLGFEQGVAIVY